MRKMLKLLLTLLGALSLAMIVIVPLGVSAQERVGNGANVLVAPPTPEPTGVVQDGAMKPMAEAQRQSPIPVSIRESVASRTIDVRLDRLDVDALLEEDEASLLQEQPRRIGVVRQLPTTVIVSGRKSTIGRWIDLRGGGILWMVTIECPAAVAIRVHLEDVNLLNGAQIIVYNTGDPQEAYGPYDARYLDGRMGFWTESAFASTVTVEYYVPPGADVKDARLRVQEIAHVYVEPTGLLAPQLLGCHNDVTCYPAWSDEARAVAGLGTIGTAGVLWCTGSLLNDLDPETWEDYFLTANHCLSGNSSDLGTQAQADTLEFYWLYQTPTCNGTPPNPSTVPRTGGGADLISVQTHDAGNDHAFLRIRRATPGGLFCAGWTTESPAATETLTGIHHPDGSHKRISFGTLDGSSTNFWDVDWISGTTEGGSSGSPLFDSSRRVIGQLRGANSVCPPNARSDYGRFNVTYPNVRRWLEIGGTIWVEGDYTGPEEGTQAKPFNAVGEANDFAWDGVRIKIKGGSYPETLVFTKTMTLLAHSGTATIGR